MAYRKRMGKRRHTAQVQEHNGTVDGTGNPTYGTPGDWDTVIAAWPCELLTTAGGETVRGKQVTAQTTHVLFGEYFGASGVSANMRIIVNGQTMSLVSAYDPNGDQSEMRVEAKIET